MALPTDEALLAAASRGDRAAFAAFVERHQTAVLGFVQRFLGPVGAAAGEDIAQETFLRAWRHAGRFRPRAKASTWLLHIAANLCLNSRRDARLRPASGLDAQAYPTRQPGPDQSSLERERAVRVQQALSALPERQRAALLLAHFEELSYAEISDVLGVSIAAVESLLVRARVALRAALKDFDFPQETRGSRVSTTGDASCAVQPPEGTAPLGSTESSTPGEQRA